MDPRIALGGNATQLTGRVASGTELVTAQAALGNQIPRWLLDAMRDLPLSEAQFSFEDFDLKWLALPALVEESTQLLPGKLLLPLGYLPVAECLQGTGDPYFLDLRTNSDDPALVRAAHDSVRAGEYDLRGIEGVARSLSDFFARVQCC